MCSTPSPPSRVHTPSTPKYGYGDSWEPFSPRKSARISAQRANQPTRTPSPRASSHGRVRATATSSFDVFSTPGAVSPQKKRQPAMDSVRRASGSLSAKGTANAADSLRLGSSQQKSKTNATTSRATATTMLPTPSKTPQKQPDEKNRPNVGAVARNLFSATSEVMTPAKKRKSKKYTGLSLDSFTAEDVEEPIEIFTDTRDRVPVVDSAAENPFYGSQQSSPVKKRGKGKQVSVPGEGKQDIDVAVQRDDGIVYTFRGKRIFRKFSPDDALSQADDEGIDGEFNGPCTPTRPRPFTRSSVKPRLLFPRTEKKGKEVTKNATTSDEEAATDIEDHVLAAVEDDVEELPDADADDAVQEPATPAAKADEKLATPVAPRFAPASPPSTVRATRTTSKLTGHDSSIKAVKPRSPFDGWRRSKSRAGPTGQKREAEALPESGESAKRPRA